MLVRVGDSPLPKMRSRKALWLLALLSMRANRPVARAWLASTLWPDVDLATAFSNLRPILSELRHVLGEHKDRLRSFDRNTICLDLTDVDQDVALFDEAMREEDFARAVDLYRGAFLEGCDEEWVAQERATREVDCLRALQILGERAIEAKDYERALGHFSRAATLDPWRDAPRRGMMRAFAEKGDINAALYTYREYAHFLRAKVAGDPDETTTLLYQQLRTEAKRNSLARPQSREPKPTAQEIERAYCFDAYRLMPERQLLLRGEARVQVGGRALDLLHLLIQRAGELVGKDELIRFCWPDTFVHENNLMVNIAALRRALPQTTGLPCIVTIPGRGYRFVAPLRVERRPVQKETSEAI